MAKKDQPEDVATQDAVTADKVADTATPLTATASKSTAAPAAVSAPKKAAPVEKNKPVAAQQSKAWFAGSLALLAVAGVTVLGFYGWQYQQANQQLLANLSEQLQGSQQNKQQQFEQLNVLRSQLTQASQANEQTLVALEQRLEQQGKRLQSLTNTSREDWQLAEAEYLIRLAGQRLLMERGTQGAIALLEAADQLLLKLEDLDLFSVREKLSRDITALKLATAVDQTGVYLSLAGLSEQVMALPLLPNQLREGSSVSVPIISVTAADEIAASAPLTAWQQLQKNFLNAFSGVGEFIKIRQHDQQPQGLLPIDGGLYLQQNIRLSIERAQLALLREEQRIYTGSLQQAAQLLTRYYDTQAQARDLAATLKTQAQLAIVIELPSINGSLLALQDYTAQLHKLGAVKQGGVKKSGVAQDREAPDAVTSTAAEG